MPRHKKTADSLLEEIERRVANTDLLTPLEKEETLKKAKEHVLAQRKDKAMADLLAKAIEAEENAFDPNEEQIEFTVDLPDFTPCITINGRMSYFHGCTYKVPMQLYRSLIDLQFQASCHQREIDGHRRQGDIQRRPSYTDLSPQHPGGRVSTTGNMRV